MKLRPPQLEVKRKLSRAEVYAESVLRIMNKQPKSCDLFEELFPQITDNPLIVYGGPGGGSLSLATDYWKKLVDIHKPHCQQQTSHSINIS